MRLGVRGAVAVIILAGVSPSDPFGTASLGSRLSASDEDRMPDRLRDTGLYELGRAFSPQYPLWSDGAAKSRWAYLPPGTTINTADDANWDFPVGTRFWKEFSFNGRKAETRMLWKASSARWAAVSYMWNDDGTDAVLAPEEGAVTAVEVAPGRRHTIPSRAECLMCHGARRTGPLGFNALQLSTDRDPGAIHGEPITADMVTLRTLVEEERLAPNRGDLVARPPRIRTTSATTRAVLGYFAGNCGSCHNQDGEIATLGPSWKHSDIADGDAVAKALVDHPTMWQVPDVAEGTSVLVSSHDLEKSAILVRMRSRRPSSQMPPLGSVVRDVAAVAVITGWMSELTRKGASQ
jgi:mono/diheme cytochrome c family protein